MKLTVFDYEELYNQSLKKARDYHDDPNCLEHIKNILEAIFPELENEDERIANALRKHLEMARSQQGLTGYFGVSYEEAVAWLKKQGKNRTMEGQQ